MKFKAFSASTIKLFNLVKKRQVRYCLSYNLLLELEKNLLKLGDAVKRGQIPDVIVQNIASLCISTAYQSKIENECKIQPFPAYAETFLDDARDLLHRKTLDYAGEENVFSNILAIEKFGIDSTLGLRIRMIDKYHRIKNLLASNNDNVGESVLDSCIDLFNYVVLLKILLNYKNK
jgi:hypothetical protein